jgi:hypothetical protein
MSRELSWCAIKALRLTTNGGVTQQTTPPTRSDERPSASWRDLLSRGRCQYPACPLLEEDQARTPRRHGNVESAAFERQAA